MIKGNVIKFGYGDVAVGGFIQEVTFRQFLPNVKPGTNVDEENVEWVGEEIAIRIDVSDYYLLIKELDKCTHRRAFEFKGYIFDFLKFDSNSIETVKECVQKAMLLHFLSLAA